MSSKPHPPNTAPNLSFASLSQFIFLYRKGLQTNYMWFHAFPSISVMLYLVHLNEMEWNYHSLTMVNNVSICNVFFKIFLINQTWEWNFRWNDNSIPLHSRLLVNQTLPKFLVVSLEF